MRSNQAPHPTPYFFFKKLVGGLTPSRKERVHSSTFKTLWIFDLAYTKSFNLIEAYSEPSVTLACRNLEYSEPFLYCVPTHIQNSVIFTKINKPWVTLEIQNPGTLKILKCSNLKYLKQTHMQDSLKDLWWSVLQK